MPKLTVFPVTICRCLPIRKTISCSFNGHLQNYSILVQNCEVTGCRECPSFAEHCRILFSSEMDDVMSCDEAALCSWPGSSRGHKRAASDADDKEVEKPSKRPRTAGRPPRESSHSGDLSGLPETRRTDNVMPCDAASCSGNSCSGLRRSSNEASGEEVENLSEILRSAECPSRKRSHPDDPSNPAGPPETGRNVVSCDEASCSNNCGSNVGKESSEMDSRETKNPDPAGTFSPSSDLIDPTGLQETTGMEMCTSSDAPCCSGNRASNSERDSNKMGDKETENPSIPFGSAGCSPCTSFDAASGRTGQPWKTETEDDASHDTCCWSWACSSSPDSSTISVSSGITVSSSSCCTPGTASPTRSGGCSRESFHCEGDSPSKSAICDHPGDPAGLQESVTENLAPCSAASCGMNVDEPAGQQESTETGNQSSRSPPCCCTDGDSNEKAVGDVDGKTVRNLPAGFPPAESSIWKSFINPSDPSGLRLILQRIPAPVPNSEDRNCPVPFKAVQNGGKTETEDVTGDQPCCSGNHCDSNMGVAGGDEDEEVRKHGRCSQGDSNDPTNLQKENELEDVVSSDACSCSWCCNSSCSSSSSSNSVDDRCKEAASKVDDKEVDAPSRTFDKTGGSPHGSSASNDSGNPTAPQEIRQEAEDTSSPGSATSCNSCLSGFVRAAREMDERAVAIPAQCPSDASSDSWTDTELDSYGELLPSLRYS